MMKNCLFHFSTTLALLLLTATPVFAINPPAKNSGATLPANAALEQIRQSYAQGFWADKMKLRSEMRLKIARGEAVENALATDTVNAPVLLGRYADMQPRFSSQSFQNLLFDGPNPTGTITDYYNEVSRGQLYMTGKTNGWFALPQNRAVYTASNGLAANSGARFAYELVVAADSAVDYSQFVASVDAQYAHVPLVVLVHTGGDAAQGAPNQIWSHRWNFNVYSGSGGNGYVTNDFYQGKPVKVDGNYAVQPENLGNNDLGSLIPIGVFAHELGHIFGLPDLYASTNNGEGLGNWCLMAGGAYGGSGNNQAVPSHPSAWCKERMGWINPITVTTTLVNQPIVNVKESGVVYKLWTNGAPANQFFLVENRVKKGYDRDLPTAGLAVYRVDNSINTSPQGSIYRVELLQADGLNQLQLGSGRGDAGDLYPGSTNNRNLTDLTSPSTRYNGSSHVAVRNISAAGDTMYATMNVGTTAILQIESARLVESA
jgi:immune inhibitor A